MTKDTSLKGYFFKKKKKRSRKRLCAAYMCVFLLVLFFKNADATSAWVSRGLELCVKKLTPSLFPFLVVSSLVVTSGAGTSIFKIFEKPLSTLFGVSKGCCAPIILGWLCGFPVGARCASELYREKSISASEYSRVLCISSIPSPAFLIGAVGGAMLGNAASGVLLYALCLISCVLVGIFLKITSRAVPVQDSLPLYEKSGKSLAASLTGAVTDSALSMLYICGFVVFFSAFLGALEGALALYGLSGAWSALLFSFFEITSGVSKISSLSGTTLPLCALAVGWSGLSVHFQTAAICSSDGIKLLPYVLSHLAKALICFALAAVICLIGVI
jgi:sporulation integral membrane protein YlbJ